MRAEKIDGTHIPTNHPASLVGCVPTPNQSETENKNDKKAADKVVQSAFVSITICLRK